MILLGWKVLNERLFFELLLNGILIVRLLTIDNVKDFQVILLSRLKGGRKFEKSFLSDLERDFTSSNSSVEGFMGIQCFSH